MGHKAVKAVVNAERKTVLLAEVHQKFVEGGRAVFPLLFGKPVLSGNVDDHGDDAAGPQSFQPLPIHGLVDGAEDHLFRGVHRFIGNAQLFPLLQIVDTAADNAVDFPCLPQLVAPLGDVGIVVYGLLEKIGQLLRGQIVLDIQVIVLRRQKIQVQPVQCHFRVPQMKLEQDAQHIRNAVDRKKAGNGAVRVVPVHIVIAKFPGKEDDVAAILTFGIDFVNVRQAVIGIGAEGTVEVMVRNDLLNGFQKTKRGDDCDSDHFCTLLPRYGYSIPRIVKFSMDLWERSQEEGCVLLLLWYNND